MWALLLIYQVFLEKEKMHRFNRFYLLAALIFSLAVPFISFRNPAPAVVGTASIVLEELVIGNSLSSTQQLSYFDYSFILWGIYGLISLVLLIRFARNILFFIKKVGHSETLNYQDATLVLIPEKVLPHTFLNYIFINRDEYRNRTIENELYTHELAHIKQRHTLDIIIIELLKIAFWFNPILPYYKKAIQLNHEFLADENVINTHHNVAPYQNLLLKKASGAQGFALASNLNFSITKKRLLMMTKTTSYTKAIFLKTAIVPTFAGLTLLLCAQSGAQQTPELKLSAEQEATLEKFRITPEEETKLKKSNPEMFSSDPAVSMKDTDFTFVDKEGKETKKQGYAKLNEEEKQKVALSPVQTAGELTFYEQPESIQEPVLPLSGLTKQPEYPGGIKAFYNDVNKNFNSPKVDKDMNARIYVSFVVEKDGSMGDIKLLRDPGYGMGAEAVRALKAISTKWVPGEMEGKKVRTSYALPISVNVKADTEMKPQPEHKKQ